MLFYGYPLSCFILYHTQLSLLLQSLVYFLYIRLNHYHYYVPMCQSAAPTKAQSDILIIERHKDLQIGVASKESPIYFVSQWILCSFSETLCVLIANKRLRSFCIWRGNFTQVRFLLDVHEVDNPPNSQEYVNIAVGMHNTSKNQDNIHRDTMNHSPSLDVSPCQKVLCLFIVRSLLEICVEGVWKLQILAHGEVAKKVFGLYDWIVVVHDLS